MALAYGAGGNLEVTMAGPFGGGSSAAKLVDITLLAADWKGGESPYSQAVTVDGISVNSAIYLLPSVEQIELLHHTGLTAANEDGAVTVYAIGDKPDADMTIQAVLMEVVSG